jgi:hypothetical protein
MRPDDAEINEEFRHRLRHHRPTTISVDGMRLAAISPHGVIEESFATNASPSGHGRVARADRDPHGIFADDDQFRMERSATAGEAVLVGTAGMATSTGSCTP